MIEQIGHAGYTLELVIKSIVPPGGFARTEYGWRVFDAMAVLGSGEGLGSYGEAIDAALECLGGLVGNERSEG